MAYRPDIVNVDSVIVDTAGRLHTRFNLMKSLKKSIPGGWESPNRRALKLSGWCWDVTTGKTLFNKHVRSKMQSI